MGFGGEGGFSAGASARAVTGVGGIGGNLPLFMMVLRPTHPTDLVSMDRATAFLVGYNT